MKQTKVTSSSIWMELDGDDFIQVGVSYNSRDQCIQRLQPEDVKYFADFLLRWHYTHEKSE